MKKIIVVSLTSLLLSTSYLSAEWVKPTKSACTSNGGKFAKGGICKAKKEESKKICSAMSGRLPAIEELKKVITSCGGVVDDFDNNFNNSNYQSCYKL